MTMRQRLANLSWGVAALACVFLPPLAEAGAHARLRDRLGPDARVNFEVLGVRATRLEVQRRGVTASIEDLFATYAGGAIRIHARGVVASYERPAAPNPASPAREQGASSASASVPQPTPLSLPVPVDLRIDGELTARRHNTSATVHSLHAAIGKDLSADLRFDVRVRDGEVGFDSVEPFVATLTSARDFTVQGRLRSAAEGPGGPSLAFAAGRRGEQLGATLHDQDQGQLRIDAPRGLAGTITLSADQMHLAAFGSVASKVLGSWEVDLSRAKLSGTTTVTRSASTSFVELQDLTLGEFAVSHPRLARERVTFTDLSLDGSVQREPGRISGSLVASHGDAQLSISASRDADALELSMDMPPTACASLFASAPDGLADPLAGTVAQGEVAGHLRVAFSRAAVEAAGEPAGPEWTPPGTLEFSFPFAKSCLITRDAPLVDLDGLSGPYRHQFITDAGKTVSRTLAEGAPGFAPLDRVALLGRAFVTLEDTRFFKHEGFDEEQIHRAFWHNLAVSRVARGASTITQQTARNLWLGGDRTASRKLAEAFLAARLEAKVDKRRILEIYVNIIELGPEVHGVAEAARYHFNKEPSKLSVLEAVYIASLAPAPRTLSIRHHRDGIDDKWEAHVRNQVRRMYLHGYLTYADYTASKSDTLKLSPASRNPGA